MSRVYSIALNTFREAVRNKILYSVVLFAAAIVGVAALFGSVTIGDQVKVIKDFGLFSLSFCGAIITIISGGSLLNRELKQKTIYNILAKPVERWQFIVGKYLGLASTVALIVITMGLGLFVFVSLMQGRPDFILLQGILLALLEMLVVAAVCIFFSALVVTTTLSGMFTFAFYVAGRCISYFSYFLVDTPGQSSLLVLTIRVFDTVLPDLSLFNFADQIVYGEPVSLVALGQAALYAFAYSTACLCFAALIFERRELT